MTPKFVADKLHEINELWADDQLRAVVAAITEKGINKEQSVFLALLTYRMVEKWNKREAEAFFDVVASAAISGL